MMAGLNCCARRRAKNRYGDEMVYFRGTYYRKGRMPAQGQSGPQALPDGTPIQFLAWYMEIVECPTCREWRRQTKPTWKWQ
jgi:hypothetical protein